jgi:recombination protein RecT
MTTANGAREGLADRVGNAVEVAKAPKPPTISQMIDRQRAEVERALPTHLKPNADAYVRAAISLVKATPKLAQCDPMTVLGGLMTASQLGLEFGPLGHCYLVPYKNNGRDEAQFQLGYKGAIDLAWRSGKLKSIAAREVCEGDEFDFDYGLDDRLHHKPDMHAERGVPYAWYGVAKFTDGGHHFVVLSKADVEEHRKHSKSKDSSYSPWKTNYAKMACKTAIHEMKPYLPLTTEILRQMSMDDVVVRGSKADDLTIEHTDYVDADPDTGEVFDADVVNAEPEPVTS